MPYSNISVTLLQEDVNAIKTALATINSKLPFLIGLSSNERRSLYKMGPKSLDFVQESLRIAQNNTDIIPSGFSTAEFAKDTIVVVSLSELSLLVNQLSEKLSDTTLAAGSEAMRSALEVYDYAKTAAKRKPGLKSAVDALSQRFKEQGLKKKRASPVAV